jgi:hypothetical protein
MAYYTRDDMTQRSALYSPLVCCATQGAGGDGWLLLPLYYSRREQGGAAAGGSEARAVLPVYYWRQDNNSRALAVLPFYADRTNFITNSRFQMRTPAWYLIAAHGAHAHTTHAAHILMLWSSGSSTTTA